MQKTITGIAFAIAALALYGCGSDSSGGNDGAAGAGGASQASGGAGGEGGAGGMESNETGGAGGSHVAADCAFDPAEAGKGPGKQIEDFPLEMWNGDRFDFHSNCGGGTKAIWVFLSTGWCGACETYARTAQEFYAQYRDQGLEVVWIVGEDQNRMPPSRRYMEQYKEAKMADFTIIRDNGFFQTRRFIDPNAAGNILPRQYVLDASNMEMVFAGGRPFERGECEMKRLLGVEGGENCEAIE